MARLLVCFLLCTAARAGAQTLQIRVATFYTPESETAALADGTTIQARVDAAVTAWQAVLDAATAGSPRVVVNAFPAVRIAITETQVCGTDLDAFFAAPRARAVRDSLRASLAVLFPEHCNASFQCVEGSPECERRAYALARARDAGTTEQALAHEAGHLFGMRHDVESDPTPGDGHAVVRASPPFFTILGQRGSLPRTALVPYDSNPAQSAGGVPIGVAGVADNASLLRRTAATVATWNLNGTASDSQMDAPVLLRAAPNPSASGWRVSLPSAPVPRTAILVDVHGRHVMDVAVAAGASVVTVPGAGLPPGTYLLRVAGSGRLATAIRLVRAR